MPPPLTLVRYDLDGQDPYLNLAAEEHLLRTAPPDTIRLVFSRNAPAVILGRNQNPWAEVDLGETARLSLPVARRSSGGGTVYHDLGNLNCGFIVPRAVYEPRRFLGIVVAALESLGIAALACDRNAVWVAGRKVAGSAFLLTGPAALLHGCVLVDSDLDALRRVLRPPAVLLRSHAVPSVRSPVTRLRDALPEVTIGAVREAIADSAARCLGETCRRATEAEGPPGEAVAALAERLRSWDWVYGRTPDFRHVLQVADGTVALQIKGARVAEVEGEGPDAELLSAAWAGLLYDGAMLAAAAERVPGLSPAFRTALAAALRREVPSMGLKP